MSEVQRQNRVSSDFSIARILAKPIQNYSRNDRITIHEYNLPVVPAEETFGNTNCDSYSTVNSHAIRERISPVIAGASCTLCNNKIQNISSSVDIYNSGVHLNSAIGCSKATGGILCKKIKGEDEKEITRILRYGEENQDTVGAADVAKDNKNTSLIDTWKDSAPVITDNNELSWLQCTRYRPPRLPRKSSAGKATKRRPGTHPRIPFTTLQLQVLEDKYKRGAYLSRRDVLQLSTTLRLPQSRVKIWFQNRRARERRETRQLRNSTLSDIVNNSEEQV
ncbi:homeobox protein engrailed-1 isoform X2 [Cephus cinctus]|uniref:Homeobox protein engrailed-1 isoform X2 n=1 Tax=Cephus cinctus TaxID=211228 RepID=A0AAJ7FLL2_CEPCN|nr:homeobox protein engrailed-1 isoform X2 [Cephus cinctus]